MAISTNKWPIFWIVSALVNSYLFIANIIRSTHSDLNIAAIVLTGLGIFVSFGSAYSEYSRNVTSVPETVHSLSGDGDGNEKN